MVFCLTCLKYAFTQIQLARPPWLFWHDKLCWSNWQNQHSLRSTHFVDQYTYCWVDKSSAVHFVVSSSLSETFCWFGSTAESSICTVDQFCWCCWFCLASAFWTADKFCRFVNERKSTKFVKSEAFQDWNHVLVPLISLPGQLLSLFLVRD